MILGRDGQSRGPYGLEQEVPVQGFKGAIGFFERPLKLSRGVFWGGGRRHDDDGMI